MSSSKPCRTVLLTDAPAKKDAFGSHDKIVGAITEILETESGGITIGIEGVWGSGKSTVVNLLREKLQQSKKTTVVTFDAWMHEGDPLRRSFLERVITALIENKWVKATKWQAVLASLAHRQITKTSTTTPKLTIQGVAISITVLAVPFGMTLFSRGFSLIGEPGTNPDFLLWASSLIMAGPLLLMGLFSAIGLAMGRRTDDLFRILANKVVTEEKTVNTEDPEPTSIEFTNHFLSVVAEALSVKDHRLVIIVDNLDRVPGLYARQIWAALRAFLEHSDADRPLWFDRLWIVVPYAHQSLTTDSKDENKDDNNNDQLSAFIDKVFQIRFYLSSPVLTDWKSYLIDELRIAFPDHASEQDEFQNIFNVINLRRIGRSSPTPRELVLFINDIGALHRQWQHNFQLSHMAYYAHLRREELEILPSLEAGTIPTKPEMELLGPDLPYNTAALYFNRNVDTARQILLRGPIEKYLGEGDGQGLQDLAKKHPKLFTVLQNQLQTLLDGWVPAPNTNKVALAADCLLQPGVLEGAEGAEARAIRSSLLRTAKKVTRWNPITEKVGSGLSLLIRDSKDTDLVTIAQNALFVGYGFDTADRTQVTDASRHVSLAAYVGFLKEAKSLSLIKTLIEKSLIPGTAHDWVLASHAFMDGDSLRDISNDMKLNCTPVEFSGECATVVTNGAITNELVVALRLAMKKQAIPLEPVGTAVGVRIAGQPEMKGAELINLLSVLQIGRPAASNTWTTLNTLANNGQLYHHISNAFTRADYKSAAYLTVCILESRPDITLTSDSGKSQDGINRITAAVSNPGGHVEYVQAFTELFLVDSDICDFKQLFGLWKVAQKARNLIRATFVALAKQDRLLGRLTVENMLAIWQEVDADELSAQKDPETLVILIKSINKQGEFTKTIMGIAINVQNARLAGAVLLSHESLQKEYISYIEKSLGDMDTAVWIEDIQKKGELGKLVRLIHSKSAGITLRAHYLDAIVDYATKIIKGNIVNVYAEGEWTAMLATLHASLRIRFKEILLEAAQDAHGAVHDQLFDVFGHELKDIDVLMKFEDLTPKLFTPIVEAKNIKGLNWMAGVIEANDGSLDGFKNTHAIEELRMRLTAGMLDSKGKPAEQAFQRIFSVWKKGGPEQPKMENAEPPTTG